MNCPVCKDRGTVLDSRLSNIEGRLTVRRRRRCCVRWTTYEVSQMDLDRLIHTKTLYDKLTTAQTGAQGDRA